MTAVSAPRTTPTRFYPEEIPSFAEEPSPLHFTIHDFGSRGRGVCALIPFQPGQALFAFTGVIVPAVTKYSLRLREGCHIHDPWFMGYVLHACEPNAACDVASRRFTAIRAIAPGEAVTIDYEATEETLHRAFDCLCGAAGCRGMIRGRRG